MESDMVQAKWRRGPSESGSLGWSAQQVDGQVCELDQVWPHESELRDDSKVFGFHYDGKLKLTNKLTYPNYCPIIS